MPPILPNWHPIAVHFTIGMLIVSTLLMTVATIAPRKGWSKTVAIVAQWNLGIGVAAATAALATGWYAFNTVMHDDPSHANMVVHLRWAFVAAGSYLIVALLAFSNRRRNPSLNAATTIVSVVAAAALIVTAWYGGENVYRYGLGVMALPDQSHHHHGAGMPDHAVDHDHTHTE